MSRADFWRQLDIIPQSRLGFPITIIGAGGIGSPTALLLAKMGCSDITVYDFDTIEPHNLPNQFYRMDDLGQPKVQALLQIIRDFTGVEIKALNERFESQGLKGVVIVAPDNMTTRSLVWKKVKLNINIPLLVDARMGGELGSVYVVNPVHPENIREYEKSLYTDEESAQTPCTATAVIYNTFMIASVIGSVIKTYATGATPPKEGILRLLNTRDLYIS